MSNINTIYVITCKINAKIYIGQTWNDIHDRLIGHKGFARNNAKYCVKLENAINKYGEDNFNIEMLDTAQTQSEADTLEDFYILAGDTIKNGYNIRRGGSHGKCSDETRAKMRASKLGDKNARFGKPISEKAKLAIEKLAEVRRGKKSSEETRMKQSKTLQPLNTDTEKYCPRCDLVKSNKEFYERKVGQYLAPSHCCIVCEGKRNKEKYLRSKAYHQRSK
jgi:group I intron endonuclease